MEDQGIYNYLCGESRSSVLSLVPHPEVEGGLRLRRVHNCRDNNSRL